MQQSPTRFLARAYRVFNTAGSQRSRWIVVEDMEHGLFQTGSCSAGARFADTRDEAIDRSDAWNALEALKGLLQLHESAQSGQPTADSIDAVTDQAEARRQELFRRAAQWNRTAQARLRESAPSARQAPDSVPKPSLAPMPHSPGLGPAKEDEETNRLIKKVWDFAGGHHLEWKPAGKTPSGREYHVLTFDGVDAIIVTQKSIEIPEGPSPHR